MFKQNIVDFVCKLTIGDHITKQKEIIQKGKLDGDEIVCSIDQNSEYSIFHKPSVNVPSIDWSTDLDLIKARVPTKFATIRFYRQIFFYQTGKILLPDQQKNFYQTSKKFLPDHQKFTRPKKFLPDR